MSWSLDTEEEIEAFAIWLLDQYIVGGLKERDKVTLPLSLDEYFDEVKEDD